MLIQVFAVGTNPFTASTKTMDGWILNPRIGSLSLAVAKRRTSLRSMVPLCPPGMKFKKNGPQEMLQQSGKYKNIMWRLPTMINCGLMCTTITVPFPQV